MVGPHQDGGREHWHRSPKEGISKVKGLALGDITAIHKEGHLMWYSFRQWLIEYYSNVPYVSDAMYTYSHLSQGGEELTNCYLSRAKVLLMNIKHTTKLSSIPGVGWDNLYLVRGLKVLHMRRRVASEQDTWRMMEDFFNTIVKVRIMKVWNVCTCWYIVLCLFLDNSGSPSIVEQ